MIFVCLLLNSCQQKKNIAFYFWESNFQISDFEQHYLDSLAVQQLYVRFFDVDIKNGKAVPVGTIQIHEKNKYQQIIPVVFITNETFKVLPQKEVTQLASNIQRKISFLYPNISDKTLQEIQIDCDWTESTKEKYFHFLNELKQQNKTLQISATIRLHQIRDRIQTGIPPIDKGVLMYYATSNPLDFKDKNSILDNAVAQNYIKNIDSYPLKLDVALPIYSWAIVENQVGEKRLINNIRNEDLIDTSLYQKLKPNFYVVKKAHYLKGNYIYEDFTIKTESISAQDLKIAQENIAKKLKNKWEKILYFQLDSSNLVHYSVQQLKTN